MKTRLLIIIGIVMMTTIPFVTYAILEWHSDSILQDSFDIDTSPKPGDKYYIEPERKAQLVAVEQDLRRKITQLHQNSLTGYGVNLDYETKKIMVTVETEQFNSEIEEIISQYPDDIPIVFYNSNIEFLDEFESDKKLTYSVTTGFEGVIIDQRLNKELHEYHFFTNDLLAFDTGSLGIQLIGIDHRDDLDGKYVKLSGTVSKKGEEVITVEDIRILYSVIPSGIPLGKVVRQVSIGEVYANPDKYYNQIITVQGELREHDADVMIHSGVGCNNAKFTTSGDFVSEFISSQLLYDDKGEQHLGVRIGSTDNIGISKLQRLPPELKNNQVELTGTFIPAIKDNGNCVHTIYKSGYVLTDFEKINPIE